MSPTDARLSTASERIVIPSRRKMAATVEGTVSRLALTVEKPRLLNEIWRYCLTAACTRSVSLFLKERRKESTDGNQQFRKSSR